VSSGASFVNNAGATKLFISLGNKFSRVNLNDFCATACALLIVRMAQTIHEDLK